MNWVGGIRNRIKLKQEKKLQKEFFERKRLQKKINTPNPTSVNGARSSNGSGQTISQDLLALQVIMQTHDKPANRRKHEIRQPTRIDLERPSHFQSKKFKHEEILDLPLPSSAKPSKLEFAGALDSVTHVKPPTRGFNEPESKTEHEDRDVTPSILGFNQASVTKQETCKVQPPSLGFGQDAITEHDECNLRVFELNSFENMKHSWQQTYFHDQPTSEEKPHSSEDMKRKFVSQKDDHMLFEKRQMQRAYQLGKSPFIPFAAPAPHSLAARSTSSTKRHYDLSEKDHILYCARSPPSMQRQTTQQQSFKIHDTSQGRKRDTYSTKLCSSEPEQLFLPKRIYKEKGRNQNTIQEYHDLALPSPIPNEVTIECLNKSDPQSFLTDLQLLDELMENQQDLGNLPNNTDINVMESSPKPLHLEPPDDDDTRLGCINTSLTSTQDEPQSDEKTSTDDVWRNFIMNADQNCSNKENEEPDQNESPREKQSPEDVPISTTDNAQSCRSKAAEELKEVMAVEQYESSQESSYYSSWSSTGSGNDCSRKSNTTTNSEKSPSKEAIDRKTNETKVLLNSSQELPSSSTSEQLAKSGQKQVYTLSGFSHSLKNISKDIAPRSQDPQRSNLSVFRIYPLSRSQDKSTQTENTDTKMVSVDHKSVQCEIIEDNQLYSSTANFPAHERPETNCGEDPTADRNVIAVSTDEDSHTKPGQSKRESLNNGIDVPTSLNTSKDNSTQATKVSVMSAEMSTKVPILPTSNDLVPGTSTHATFNGHLMTSSDHPPGTTPKNGDQSVSTKCQPQMTTDPGTSVTIHSSGSLANGTSRIPTEANNVLSTQSNQLPVTAPQTSDTSALTTGHPLTTTASGTSHKSTEVNDQLTTQFDHLTPIAPQQNSDYIRSTENTPVTIASAIPMTTSSSVVTSKTYITAEAKDTMLVTQCNHHTATALKNNDYSSTENLSGTTNSLAAPLDSSTEDSSKTLQTRTMTNFPSTNLTLTAGTPCSVTETSGTTPSSNLAIQPSFPKKTTDMKQTVFSSGNSELHKKKDDYQSTIKKLQEHVEQLQNINVYQSIVIKFLEM